MFCSQAQKLIRSTALSLVEAGKMDDVEYKRMLTVVDMDELQYAIGVSKSVSVAYAYDRIIFDLVLLDL